jgi:antitoxin MazE
MVVKLNKWGHSLGIRIPKDIAEAFGLEPGSTVEVTQTETGVLLTPRKPALTLAYLLEGMEEAQQHEDQIDTLLPEEDW